MFSCVAFSKCRKRKRKRKTSVQLSVGKFSGSGPEEDVFWASGLQLLAGSYEGFREGVGVVS